MAKSTTTDLTTLNPDDNNHRRLTATEFQQLATIPPEQVWLTDIARNPHTRRAYKRDIDDFCHFVGLHQLEELRLVTSAHVVAWRTDIENRLIPDGTDPEGQLVFRKPSGSLIRRKLAALSSLFDYLCDKQAIASNPVRGLKRPKANNNEGATQALGDAQVRALLSAPPADTLKGKRDRAIIATLFFHALRRQELCHLKVKDIHTRQGVPCFRIQGKGSKVRHVEIALPALRLITDYLEAAGHGEDRNGALFRPLKNNVTKTLHKPLTVESIYNLLRFYADKSGVSKQTAVHPHMARATAITNSLHRGADMKHVQKWAGHANISTTRIYDQRDQRAEDSPSFKVGYGVLE